MVIGVRFGRKSHSSIPAIMIERELKPLDVKTDPNQIRQSNEADSHGANKK
jgi:hypothetical protein